LEPFDLAKRSFTFKGEVDANAERPWEEELMSTISFSKSRMEKVADSVLVQPCPAGVDLDDVFAGGTEPPIAIH
jgi:hypothetical protein